MFSTYLFIKWHATIGICFISKLTADVHTAIVLARIYLDLSVHFKLISDTE